MGLSIFPIYQDGGWEESYFNEGNGLRDGSLAHNAAFKLGFPYGATIYFAVDVDILDGNIPGTVLPYIKKVKESLDANGMYKTEFMVHETSVNKQLMLDLLNIVLYLICLQDLVEI